VWDLNQVIVTVTITCGTLMYTTWGVARTFTEVIVNVTLTFTEVIVNVTITSGTLMYSYFYTKLEFNFEVIVTLTITHGTVSTRAYDVFVTVTITSGARATNCSEKAVKNHFFLLLGEWNELIDNGGPF
jgi:hypothetical protein